ncbi:MAG: thioesterase, partial [Flavobacteriales bacterium CG_4_9_14_3_um_filter_40_17]
MLTARKLNTFTFFKLPSAFFTGVRVMEIDAHQCKVGVRHRWINQNPFGSLYFAVQAMAAELSTGALVIRHIQDSGKNVSMLVARNESTF